jgi:hypothetical protein
VKVKSMHRASLPCGPQTTSDSQNARKECGAGHAAGRPERSGIPSHERRNAVCVPVLEADGR